MTPKKEKSHSSQNIEQVFGFQGRILVVEDDDDLRQLIIDYFTKDQFEVIAFSSGIEFLNKISSIDQEIDTVLTDLRMPEVGGLEVLAQCKRYLPLTPVIIMTAHASVETAIEGLRRGAFDYVTKPFKLFEMTLTIQRAVSFAKLQRQNKILTLAVSKVWSPKNIIGKSKVMKVIVDQIPKLAAVPTNILITGESGTGKEVIARAIHSASSHADKPFVAINCSAIPENLLESELFGHVKGAFTGAHLDKIGLFDAASEGTLFLDEIGDMPLSLQSKLLRVIQEKQYRPVGSTKDKKLNTRIIAATHQDLNKSIHTGKFREDLYFRLNVIPINIPPLRDRPEDIPLLANHFLIKYAALSNNLIKGISNQAMDKLIKNPWRGNIRELENMIERLIVTSPGPLIEAKDIPLDQLAEDHFFSESTDDIPTLANLEKRYMEYILKKTGNKKEKAALILGINRRTLYRKEREYGFVNEE